MSAKNSVKRIYNHLSGKNLRKLEAKGKRQQRLVTEIDNDLSWLQKNVTLRKPVKENQKILKHLDEQYDTERKRLLYDRVTAGIGVGSAAVLAEPYINREKTASSRLMNLLKGTRHKAINRRIKSVEEKMRKAEKGPATRQSTFDKLDDEYNALRKERFAERSKRIGTYVGLGSLPVLGATHFMKKESALKTKTKLLIGSVPFGASVGAGVNLLDDDIENSASNVTQSALLGAGVSGLSLGVPVLISSNPKIKEIVKNIGRGK